MAALIAELIDKVDNVELVRDEIAAILALESANQVNLAFDAGEDEKLWKLRVFMERSSPLDEWTHLDADETAKETSPIVNVWLSGVTYDESRSDAVERQLATATYNIDCYGYGISAQRSGRGFDAGDELAARAAQRATRLVRNILMSSQYTYLGHRGLVWKRWIRSGDFVLPAKDGKAIDRIAGSRLELTVDLNEFSPQYQGEPLELISLQVTQSTTDGQLLVRSDVDLTQIPTQ